MHAFVLLMLTTWTPTFMGLPSGMYLPWAPLTGFSMGCPSKTNVNRGTFGDFKLPLSFESGLSTSQVATTLFSRLNIYPQWRSYICNVRHIVRQRDNFRFYKYTLAISRQFNLILKSAARIFVGAPDVPGFGLAIIVRPRETLTTRACSSVLSTIPDTVMGSRETVIVAANVEYITTHQSFNSLRLIHWECMPLTLHYPWCC